MFEPAAMSEVIIQIVKQGLVRQQYFCVMQLPSKSLG
jgi:hypothetical protein